MKNKFSFLIYLLGFIFLIQLNACTRPEAPVFEMIRDISLKERTKDTVTLTAYADFYNPNNYKMILKKADIDLLLNGKKISSLHQEFDLIIEKRSEFSVPLEATFSQDQINGNLISSAINILLGRKLTINYEGNIKVKAYGIRIRVPVEGESKIDIRDL